MAPRLQQATQSPMVKRVSMNRPGRIRTCDQGIMSAGRASARVLCVQTPLVSSPFFAVFHGTNTKLVLVIGTVSGTVARQTAAADHRSVALHLVKASDALASTLAAVLPSNRFGSRPAVPQGHRRNVERLQPRAVPGRRSPGAWVPWPAVASADRSGKARPRRKTIQTGTASLVPSGGYAARNRRAQMTVKIGGFRNDRIQDRPDRPASS